MIFVNSVGLALFVGLVESVFKEQEKVGAIQAQTALNIALQTLPFLRNGLSFDSAREEVRIILNSKQKLL